MTTALSIRHIRRDVWPDPSRLCRTLSSATPVDPATRCSPSNGTLPTSSGRSWTIARGKTQVTSRTLTRFELNAILCSVTRFGEISQLWLRFKNLWQTFKAAFIVGQNYATTLAKFHVLWQILNVVNRQILKKNLVITLILCNLDIANDIILPKLFTANEFVWLSNALASSSSIVPCNECSFIISQLQQHD